MHRTLARSLGVLGVMLCTLAAARPAAAQTNIHKINKFAYQENCGWTNWREAGDPSGADAAFVHPTFLSGFLWSENTGWINLGDGTPDNGVSYANPMAGPVVGVPDFGVNRDPISGALSGFAWGENVGWINFGGGAAANPPKPAVYDAPAYRLRGFAWGENIGWLNLDDDEKFVAVRECPADFNEDGFLTIDDLFLYFNAYFTSVHTADFNGVGGVTIDDLFLYINAYFVGC